MRVQNKYILEDNNVYLEIITSKGNKIYFIIDAEYLNFAKSKTWYAMYCPKRKTHYLESNDRVKYYRYITNCPDNLVVDHIDRDTYDNRLCNLRVCSISDNNKNRYYPETQRKPKGSNTGVNYISYMSNGAGNNFYFCVRYKKNKRKYFKTLDEAVSYLNILKKGETKYENG